MIYNDVEALDGVRLVSSFGQEAFLTWTHFQGFSDVKTWDIISPKDKTFPSILRNLFEHGFIADCAPVWSKSALNGSEIAIVSRTYCTDYEIDSIGNGLKIWRFPKDVFPDDPGTVIATVLYCRGKYAIPFLDCCMNIPAWLFVHALPLDMKLDREVETGINLSVDHKEQIFPNIEIT